MYRRCDAGGNGGWTFGVRRVAIVAVNQWLRAAPASRPVGGTRARAAPTRNRRRIFQAYAGGSRADGKAQDARKTQETHEGRIYAQEPIGSLPACARP